MKKKYRGLAAWLMACVLSLCCLSVPAQAYTLSFIRYTQEQSNWCWAASIQMLTRYRTGTYYSQPYIVSTLYGAVVNLGADLNQSASAYAAVSGLSVTKFYSPLSFSSAKSKIDSGIPFLVGLKWSGDGGHVVTCSGYLSSNQRLYINDPAYNCSSDYFYYSSMISNCDFQSGNGKWNDGIY